jgi:TatD DNase family protein
MTPLVDSHAHIDFPDLVSDIPGLLAQMRENGVHWCLCPGVTLDRLPAILALARTYPTVFAAVGVHPDTPDEGELGLDELSALASEDCVVGIGETGLDYYRIEGDAAWQRTRFRTHIHAALRTDRPLIIHTRAAAPDTLAILREEGAAAAGGVFHCFTESAEVARAALDLGFYISMSGIVTFKNAVELKEVARMVPLDRLLVETDAPYLAPVPYRGKTNRPAYVRHVAEEVARLKGLDVERIAEATTDNFFRLFARAKR